MKIPNFSYFFPSLKPWGWGEQLPNAPHPHGATPVQQHNITVSYSIALHVHPLHLPLLATNWDNYYL